MTGFLYAVFGLLILCNIGTVVWFIMKSKQSDAQYERDLDGIYTRKRKQ